MNIVVIRFFAVCRGAFRLFGAGNGRRRRGAAAPLRISGVAAAGTDCIHVNNPSIRCPLST